MQNILKRSSMALSVLALGAGLYAGASHMAAETLRARLLSATALSGVVASVDGIAVNPLTGAFRIDGVKLKQAGGTKVRIRQVSHKGDNLALVTRAFAQQTFSFTLEDVEIEGKAGSITADELIVEDATLNEDALAELFDADSARTLIDGLKGLSFKSMRAPEIEFEFTVPGGSSKQSFKDVVFDRMRNGRIERAAAASGGLESKPAQGPAMTGSHGLYEIRGFDSVLMARFVTDKAAPGEGLSTVYESFAMENFKIGAPGVIDYSIGKMESGAMRLKPLAVPLAELIAKMPAKGQPNLPPEEVKVYAPAFLGLFDSLSDDGFEARDIKFSVPAAGGTGAIARISGSFGGGKVPAGFKVETISATGPGMSFKLASMGSEGFSLKPFIVTALKAIEAGDIDFNNVDPRDLMPKLGSSHLRGVEFDLPDPKPVRGQPPGRLTGGVGAVEFAAKGEIKGVPTDLAMAVDRVTLKVPMTTNDETLRTLLALGYSAVDVSARAGLKWDEAKKEINLTELTVGGVNMGSAKLTASIGNVGRELFEADLPMMQVAALGATARSVTLKVENTGLAERLFEAQAKQQGRKADEIRAEMGSMAALGIPAVLGPSDDAKALANALGRFLARPRTLTVEASAKNAGGVGLPDMATLTNPQQALTLINLKATAD